MRLGWWIWILYSTLVFAQEQPEGNGVPAPDQQSLTNASAPVPEPVPEASPTPSPVATKRIHREKEAEGSEAKNRFTQDPVVKSQYRIGGQALEVDPD